MYLINIEPIPARFVCTIVPVLVCLHALVPVFYAMQNQTVEELRRLLYEVVVVRVYYVVECMMGMQCSYTNSRHY